MDITNVLSGLIEKVRTAGQLPVMLQMAPNLVLGLIGERNVVTDVNQKMYRIPFKQLQGGNFGKLSANNGTFGTGNGFTLNNLQCGYFYYSQSHAINLEVMETAQGNGSVVNAFSELVADANDMAQKHLEILIHGSGNGVLTNASSAYAAGSATYTFAGSSDKLGVNRLIEGMTVDVYNSALDTIRANGPYRIMTIDHAAKTVVLNSAPTSGASTDRLVIRDLDVYGPATPTTFASTYPTAGANGIAGDSFFHGLDYYLDTTPANYLLGIQKSAVPQLQAKHVPAGTVALTYLHPFRLIHKMLRSRGTKPSDLIALVPLAQYEQLAQINMSLQTIQLTGEQFGKVKDLSPTVPELGGDVAFGNIRGKIDLRQQEDRVQVICPSEWGVVQPKKLDFYKSSGGYIHNRRNANGELTAGKEVILYGAQDWFCVDPGKNGVVDGLTTPTGAF